MVVSEMPCRYTIRLGRGTCLLLALLILAASTMAFAQAERRVLSIEPATIRQGDTVLLTIMGENLPTGTVIVEFFPQQIALLDILASSAEEILAQVKVPALAPPGAYNVLIYNHLGDDVFGEALLSITSEVITPIFTDFEPKSIGEVSEGFALLLMGDAITPGAVDHLSMRWRKGDRYLDDLVTTFSKGGRGQILCAITGDIPSGILQGRIHLNDIPIYMVEVTNTTPGGVIVGQQQIELNVAEPPYVISLLGTGFTAGFMSDLSIELSSPDITSRPIEVNLADASSFSVVFNGPLPAGVYTLNVRCNGQAVYASELELNQPEPAADSSDAAESDSAQTGSDSTEQASTGEPAAAPTHEIHISDVTPRLLEPGPGPTSFAVAASGVSPEVIDGLVFSLTMDGQSGSLLFVGSGSDNLTCLFAPPNNTWQSGATGTLSIHDPQGIVAPFAAELTVSIENRWPGEAGTTTGAALPVVAADVLADNESVLTAESAGGWDIIQATVVPNKDASELRIEFAAPDTIPAISQLGGSFTLLPADPQLLQYLDGFTLDGDLSFTVNAAGLVTGTAAGLFTSGDLLVSMGSGDAPLELMTFELAAPAPRATIIPPATEWIIVDPQTGLFTPAELRWVVDFAPLTVLSPGIIGVTFQPDSGLGTGMECSIQAEGSTIVITQTLLTWAGTIFAGDNLDVSLESTRQVTWDGKRSWRLTARNATTPPANLVVSVLDKECLLENSGMEFSLLIRGDLPDNDILAAAELESDNLLLNINLENFRVSTTVVSTADPKIVMLQLDRVAAELDEIAYQVLAGELIEQDSVTIVFTWPALGYSFSENIIFSSTRLGAANDI